MSLSLALAAAGCTTVPPRQAGTLSTYRKLGEEKGKFSKSRTYVDGQALVAAKTARIVPTSFATNASALVTAQADRALVTNALDRELCIALSDKYEMVTPTQPADLTVRAVITDIVPTDKTMAGVSTAVTLGSSVALPIGIPRLPVGLGGLSVEAEALDRSGAQRAAMVWGRGANSIQNTPQASEVSDAYGLASTFAGEFSRILVTGEEPQGLDIALPSRQRVRSWLGGSHKYATCEAYGRSPGIAGAIARKFGAPPELADKQDKTPLDPSESRSRQQPAPAH
ncbi:DUF3313 domain-containing protein [Bosea sp. NPDC055332]